MKSPGSRLALGVVFAAVVPLAAESQGSLGSLYVAEVAGGWRIAGATQPLAPLDKVSATARIEPVDPGAVQSHHKLVLRDPQTLRTFTWSCERTAACRQARGVGELRAGGNQIPGSRRTRALFLQLGGNDALRSRVELLGARGDDRNWGLQVLVVDRGEIDLAPLSARAGQGRRVVVRFCPLGGGSDAEASECRVGRDLLPTDCVVAEGSRCARPAGATLPTAVRVDVYLREQSMLSSVAHAHGVAVLVAAADARVARDHVSALSHELAELRTQVSGEELRGLYAAAAVETARILAATQR